ncbi:MAG: FAD:protein FMN transferase [Gammaproteobacteria bacterium]|nr:FAD:protein FMN transferase [Gammaproteobacteria bacterium]MDH5692246.1 FAD:protein FMN transferase [Gammaproteobacteria bacterium]
MICRSSLLRAVSVVLITLLVISCTKPAEESAELHHFQLFALGTTVSLDFYDVSANKANNAMQEVTEDLRYMQNAWHPHKPGTLGRVNQILPLKGSFHTSGSVINLLQAAKPHFTNSEGLFNPAIGQLIKLWGFHEDEIAIKEPPQADKIKALVAAKPGLDQIEIKGTAIKGNNDQLLLNFGGFAKGFGIDLIIEHLREVGIHNAIVNAGGDLRVVGSKGSEPWRIGIKHPRQNGVIAAINVSGDEALVTSGDYERFFEYDGKRYHHVLDPRTGYPTTGVQSVTVVHQSAGAADAIATALMVAGEKDWPRIAKKMGARSVMVVLEDGRVQLTEKLQDRVEFKVQPLPKIDLIKL